MRIKPEFQIEKRAQIKEGNFLLNIFALRGLENLLSNSVFFLHIKI